MIRILFGKVSFQTQFCSDLQAKKTQVFISRCSVTATGLTVGVSASLGVWAYLLVVWRKCGLNKSFITVLHKILTVNKTPVFVIVAADLLCYVPGYYTTPKLFLWLIYCHICKNRGCWASSFSPRKHHGESLVCDESFYSEDSGN